MPTPLCETNGYGPHRPAGAGDAPRLLVSVRDAAEAGAALAGGADYIDVKEPSRGPMGAADASTIAEVIRVVAGRRPVTAAAGELTVGPDAAPHATTFPPGLAVLKLGLAGAAGHDWRRAIHAWRDANPGVVIAPTLYADHARAGSPECSSALRSAAGLGLRWAVIDTFDKTAGDLLAYMDAAQLRACIRIARASGCRVALAGRLLGERLALAATLGPDVVGVRSAACGGDRQGMVTECCVREARVRIAAASVRTRVETRTEKT